MTNQQQRYLTLHIHDPHHHLPHTDIWSRQSSKVSVLFSRVQSGRTPRNWSHSLIVTILRLSCRPVDCYYCQAYGLTNTSFSLFAWAAIRPWKQWRRRFGQRSTNSLNCQRSHLAGSTHRQSLPLLLEVLFLLVTLALGRNIPSISH